MKKSVMAVLAAVFLSLLCAPLPAQMDNLTNLSVEWMRMPARNAASDSADIVVYNPAALVRLAEGFHLNLGNQVAATQAEPHLRFRARTRTHQAIVHPEGHRLLPAQFLRRLHERKMGGLRRPVHLRRRRRGQLPAGIFCHQPRRLYGPSLAGAGRERPAHRDVLRRPLLQDQGPLPEGGLLLPDRHPGRGLRHHGVMVRLVRPALHPGRQQDENGADPERFPLELSRPAPGLRHPGQGIGPGRRAGHSCCCGPEVRPGRPLREQSQAGL